jgi:hypothetical protein
MKPRSRSAHHLAAGTTSMNCTIYHDIGRQGALTQWISSPAKDANR